LKTKALIKITGLTIIWIALGELILKTSIMVLRILKKKPLGYTFESINSM